MISCISRIRRAQVLVAIVSMLLSACARERSASELITPQHTVPTAPLEQVVESITEVETEQLAPDAFFQALRNSVVLVLNTQAGILGSGVEIDKGLFVTNCHVLEGGRAYSIRRDGRLFAATLEAGSRERDICLLRGFDTESHPAKIRSTDSVQVGERVYALGNPQGLELTLSEGIVSQLRKAAAGETYPYIQTTAPISQGSSGGGLFDLRGNLIGIPSFMSKEGQNLNFAAPIDWALELQSGSYNVPEETAESVAGSTAVEPPSVLNARAIALINTGRPQDAVPLLLEANERDPGDAEILGNLGYAYLKMGEYSEARDRFEDSLGVSPERAATWLNLGQTMAELGHRDLAVQSVLKGYERSSRKKAVLTALVKAKDDANESKRWQEVAGISAEILQPGVLLPEPNEQ